MDIRDSRLVYYICTEHGNETGVELQEGMYPPLLCISPDCSWTGKPQQYC